MNKKQEKNNSTRTIEDDLYLFGLILSAAVLLYGISAAIWPQMQNLIKFPPCLFHLLTGYYCPGCGGTRAVRALLWGRILQSFFYHPLVPYSAAVFLYFMITQSIERLSRQKFRIGMRYRNVYVWTAVAILAGNFIVRNLLHYKYGFTM